MSFFPNRISKKDPFTDEIITDYSAISRNFQLIAKETNFLDDRINSLSLKGERTTKILQKNTKFVNVFLFG